MTGVIGLIKKVPVRTCLGCNEEKPKKELVRAVRTPQGEVILDLTGKQAGRGAYICPDINCLKKARKAKRFERALSCTVSDELYEKMEETLLQAGK